MERIELPIPLARAFMRVTPASALSRMIAILMQRMERRHPRLFQNLARLKPGVVYFEPSDLPHRFVLQFGGAPARLFLMSDAAPKPDAVVKGNLKPLLDMLEGRIDGDMLFFEREIAITGDTSVVIGLRNTMDREEIDLMSDITSLFGPFAQPVGRVLQLADKVAKRIRQDILSHHEEIHRRQEAPHLNVECQRLRDEIADLKRRLEKHETKMQEDATA